MRVADVDLETALNEIKAACEVANQMLRPTELDVSPVAMNDRRLREALHTAIDARELIAVEQKRIDGKMAVLEAGTVKCEYLAYQRELVEKQLTRAADLAEQRLERLNSLNTAAEIQAEMELCRDGLDGMIHWFYYYAWTADPRPDAPLYSVPFGLFDFQLDLVEWLWKLIFEERADGTIDKSRDMGVSWVVVGFSDAQFLLSPSRSPFTALFGSRKEDYVNTTGDMSSLFEKLRYMLRLVPGWQLPKGWNPAKHAGSLKIENPETGATLTGESSNDDFGRAGRYTAIFFDEFASFPGGGYAAWTASSESTRSRIPISTPKGKFNKFSEIVHDESTASCSLHWKKHPWKDDRWYDWQHTRMTAVEIAQELDLDYEGSLAGRLLPMWDEATHVITWSEFAKYFGKSALDANGQPRIPADWQIGWAHDVGTTEDHPAVLIMAATAAENTPLPGHVFLFKEIVIPENGIPSLFAPLIRDVADPWNLWDRLSMSLISHEGNSERLTYETMGIFFERWDTEQGYTQGYSQLQTYLTPNRKRKHPFRPELMAKDGKTVGCPKMFVVVSDDQGGLIPRLVNGEQVGWMSRPALKDDPAQNGFARLRREFPSIHIPTSEEGKPARARRHFKKLDDAFDCARALAAQFFPGMTEKSKKERERELLPDNLKDEAFEQNVKVDPNGVIYGLADAKQKIKRERDEEDAPRRGGLAGVMGRTGKQMNTVRTMRRAPFNKDNTTLYFDDDDD